MTNTSDIGEAIRRARKGVGLRQDQLAAAAGVGLRFLVELERGKPTSRIDGAFKVLQALGIKLALGASEGATHYE